MTANIYTYLYRSIHIYAYLCISTHVSIHVCTYIDRYIYLNPNLISTYTSIYVSIPVSVSMSIYRYIICIYIDLYVYIHLLIHLYVTAHTDRCLVSSDGRPLLARRALELLSVPGPRCQMALPQGGGLPGPYNIPEACRSQIQAWTGI